MSSALLFTSVAMIAFASNSVLARLALGNDAIDAAGYTIVRLISGAAILVLLVASNRRSAGPGPRLPGSWLSALALFTYAILFSLAYLKLGVAMGALILFATVQGTMIGWGYASGKYPTAWELAGLIVAFGAFVYLLWPGLSAPDPLGSVFMIGAGAAWGAYSLRGRDAVDPLGETAGNFIRALPMCIPLLPFAVSAGAVSPGGVVIATAAGVASCFGYVVWYRVLPALSPAQSAIVQLTVPVIAALAGVLLIAEVLTVRLAVASFFLLGGVALAILSRAPMRSA